MDDYLFYYIVLGCNSYRIFTDMSCREKALITEVSQNRFTQGKTKRIINDEINKA